MGEIQQPTSEDGAGLIALERNRQIISCGHDDSGQQDGYLAYMASRVISGSLVLDPADILKKHPDRLEQLIIAGALIAAEIDLLIARRESDSNKTRIALTENEIAQGRAAVNEPIDDPMRSKRQ